MLREARRFWALVAVVFLVNLLSAPLSLLVPIPLKITVDHVIGSQPLPAILQNTLPASMHKGSPLLIFAVAMVVVVALLNRLQGFGSSVLAMYVTERMVLDFRSKIFRHVQRLSLGYHDARGTTDSMYRIHHDASAIQRITLGSITPFVTAAITLLAMIYVISSIDWQLAIVAVLVAPALFFVIRGYRRPLRRQWRTVKNLEHSAWKVTHEVLGALRVVKAFGQEDREHGRFVRQSYEGGQARIRVEVAQGSYSLIVGMITALATAAVLFLGVTHVLEGTLTIGALLVVMSYLSQLFGPLKTMGKEVTSLQGALTSAERAFAVLDETPDVAERPNARPLARTLGTVDVEKVVFAYEEGNAVLKDLSFHVPNGTRVGIAGKTGAGKTTLLNLVTRFYDPQAGRVMLDGIDMRDYKLDDLRNQFAIVLQEPVLFSTSIAENIAYGRPEARPVRSPPGSAGEAARV